MGRDAEFSLTERAEKQIVKLTTLFSSRSDVVRQAVAAFHKAHRAEIREKKRELMADAGEDANGERGSA